MSDTEPGSLILKSTTSRPVTSSVTRLSFEIFIDVPGAVVSGGGGLLSPGGVLPGGGFSFGGGCS